MSALVLDSARTALLCMDFQRDIALPGGKLAPDDPVALGRFAAAIERATVALVTARERGILVIHVRVAARPGFVAGNPHTAIGRFIRAQAAVVEGEPGVEFVEALAPRATEPIVTKRMVSAFVGTDLEQLLRGADIDTLVLTGLVTHFVVEGTARHAADLGYRAITLSDACASGVTPTHEASLRILARLGQVATVDDFVAATAATA